MIIGNKGLGILFIVVVFSYLFCGLVFGIWFFLFGLEFKEVVYVKGVVLVKL